MEIFVYSRGAVERVRPHDVPHGVVSITSSEADLAEYFRRYRPNMRVYRTMLEIYHEGNIDEAARGET